MDLFLNIKGLCCIREKKKKKKITAGFRSPAGPVVSLLGKCILTDVSAHYAETKPLTDIRPINLH